MSRDARSGGLTTDPQKLHGLAFSFWAFAVGVGAWTPASSDDWSRA
jgi:hypothetical protein